MLRLLGVVAALAALQCEPTAAPPPPPHLVFDETTYDFGTVDQGTPVTHAFTFRNAGGAELTINNVKVGCDCTVAGPAPRVVPPGGRGAIQVSLDTTRAVRADRRTVTVYSNDPSQPVTTLTLGGAVTIDVAVDPPALYLGHVRRGARGDNEARIITGGPLALSLPATEGRVLHAALVNPATGQSGKTLAVSVKPDAPPGRFAESITIATSSRTHPAVTVAVVGIVETETE